jgi:hypothetical protein
MPQILSDLYGHKPAPVYSLVITLFVGFLLARGALLSSAWYGHKRRFPRLLVYESPVLGKPLQDGLTSSHPVTIYRTSDQAIMAGATITTADGVDVLYRYQSIAPVVLTAGTPYRIAGEYTVAGVDLYLAEVTSYTADGAITFNSTNGAVFDSTGLYPSQIITNRNGHFTVNFKFIASGVSAPEPTTLSLLAIGIFDGVVARRKRLTN